MKEACIGCHTAKRHMYFKKMKKKRVSRLFSLFIDFDFGGWVPPSIPPTPPQSYAEGEIRLIYYSLRFHDSFVCLKLKNIYILVP